MSRPLGHEDDLDIMDGDQMRLRRSENLRPEYGLLGWLVVAIVHHWMSELVPALRSEE